MVQVYSKDNCVQCNMTYKVLDAQGTDYEVIKIDKDPKAFDYVTQELGYQQAPVVVTPAGEHWSGFRPDRLKTI